ncbi:MAG: rane protein [Paenibacillaceae bacterium]|nr:rane protein [Paenibacillaceae bacterium]
MLFKRVSAAWLITFLCLFTIVLLLAFPEVSLQAAAKGVAIWWDVLFPALFPFLVIAEVMRGFGIVHFFGTLLDPLMRPLFGVPGIGGFVMAMGFASGYPVGARLTAQLWEQGLINRIEGERLAGFSTTSDPIFLIGAVSVGFFGDPSLAPILAIAHYGGAVLVGLAMRWVGPRPQPVVPAPGANLARREFVLARALRAMHWARLADGRTFGTLLKVAVYQALQLVLMIGGLVVFFSVVIDVMTTAHIMSVLHTLINAVFKLVAVPPALTQAIVNGLFEVTLGAKAAGAAGGAIPLSAKTAIAALVLSWGGLSVHAQIVSLLHHTNLRYGPFLFARLLHSVLSCALVVLLWEPLQPLRGAAETFLTMMSWD